MKIQLNPQQFTEIIKKGYSLDIIFMLKLVEVGLGAPSEGSAKVSATFQTLIRKGLITDNGEKLTTTGQELLKYISVEIEEEDKTIPLDVKKFVKTKVVSEDFESFWKFFPGTDTFVHKDKTFSGCRSLRQNRDDCRLKFDKIILVGEYSAVEIIEALKYDVNQKKEQSVRTGNNKLSYMQNSLTYLNQLSFEPFIELIREGIKLEEVRKVTGGTDI